MRIPDSPPSPPGPFARPAPRLPRLVLQPLLLLSEARERLRAPFNGAGRLSRLDAAATRGSR